MSAQVEITEVMYDAPGADEGREWVEVTNMGSEPYLLTKHTFVENGTNHGLKLISGSPSLASQGSAIIASDAAAFLREFPNFSGALFDSSFTLSNKGESVGIAASSTVVGSLHYTPLPEANGTGGSLQKKGDTFVAALPTPGIYPGVFTPVPAAKTATAKTSTKKSSTGDVATKKAVLQPQNFASPEQYTASLAQSSTPIPTSLLWGVALAGVLLLSCAAVIFARVYANTRETISASDEFTIE